MFSSSGRPQARAVNVAFSSAVTYLSLVHLTLNWKKLFAPTATSGNKLHSVTAQCARKSKLDEGKEPACLQVKGPVSFGLLSASPVLYSSY